MMVIITGLFQQPQKASCFLFLANRFTKILLPHDSFFTAGKRDLTYIPESGPQKSGNEKTATVADISFLFSWFARFSLSLTVWLGAVAGIGYSVPGFRFFPFW